MILAHIILFIVHFQVSKHKKDPEKIHQQKQFIAWWIDKHFQKSPDEPIVVLFDMQGAGISNMVGDWALFFISYILHHLNV